MTDYDADEIVKQRRREAKMPLIDKVLAAIGLTMAAFATFFPWYASVHRGEFSMPRLWQATTGDLPDHPGRDVQTVSSQAFKDMDSDTAAAVDRLTTATVPGLGDAPGHAQAEADAAMDQPFPGQSRFSLKHVINGRALIEDASGMYIVRVGSILPDNSRLATFQERNGRWVMITSKGEIYEEQ